MNTLASLAAPLLISTLAISGWSQTPASKRPDPVELLAEKLHPGHDRPDLMARHTPEERNRILAAERAGTLTTLPHWQGSFSIHDKEYHYTIVGGDPAHAEPTTIPTVIVPIRLTVSDYSEDGVNPLVLDATPIVRDILHSPIFEKSNYITGYQQFTDGMLRAEFPQAPPTWHTVLSPSVYSTVDVTAPPGAVHVFRAKSGKLLADIRDDSLIDDPIFQMIGNGVFAPDQFVIFVTYNALEHDAFGYHAALFRETKTQEMVFAYSSWLVGVDDLFFIPSPDTATLSHEVAETIHDAFLGSLSSLTLLWGDPFFHNECFQRFIEVGDAVEDAPARVQLHEQVVGFGKQARVYTLQNEATLQWFERKDPSDALAATYSFPDIWVLKKPAPDRCVP